MQSPQIKSSLPSQDEEEDDDSSLRFGEASPLRNPLAAPPPKKKPSTTSSVFLPKQRPHQQIRPITAPRTSADARDSLDAQKTFYLAPGQPYRSGVTTTLPNITQITNPANAPLKAVPPPPRPAYSSTSGSYYPAPATKPFVDLTRQDDDDDDRFDPDAVIRDESRKFGAEDPYMYVDSSQANENIKNLLEGAFDDDEQKGRTRLRSRAKKVEKDVKEAKSLADKLASLNVADKEKDKAGDEEEEEEEDGTVEGLTVKLLPHQVEGVSWMIEKEIGMKKMKGVLPHGGILADDMGLGKTVQSVTLILTNPRPSRNAKPEHPKQKLPGPEVSKCTLVVAPLALIKQWEAEIKSKVSKSHALKVLVHHGPSRTKSSDQLSKYDVVITTYQTLTSEHAGSNMINGGAKIGCMGVHWYRIFLDEAHSIKNRNAKSTQACYALNSWYRWCLTGTPMQNNLDELQSLIKFLRIKPYCDLPPWKEQITQPMKNGRGGIAMRRLQVFLRACMKRRTKDILKEEGALNFGGKAGKEGENSGGMQIVKREVETVECDFDEDEQEFYDRLQQRADQRLQDMMDGPGKNDYMGALVLLLRLRQACNHPHLIEKAISKDKDAMTTGLPNSQTPSRKASKAEDDMDSLAALMGGVTVHNKTCDVCQAKLSSHEMREGAVRCSECESALRDVKQRKKERKDKKKAEHSRAQADKRRARNRKIIEDSDDEDAEGGGESLATMDSDRSDEETSEVIDSPSRARNRDQRASRSSEIEDEEEEATDESEDNSDSATDDESEVDSEDSEDDSEANILSGMAPSSKISHAPSTKIRHLLRILHRESPEHKTIVFSQFTTMLDLIEPHLKASNTRFVRYDGSMRPDAREQSLHSLRNDPKTRVLLCSLKCGSLGLNLTAASRVVIVEPFWNPFVEEQAIDRVHRLNQTVDVKVFRLTIRNSVEERIIDLQERKRELANAAIEGGKGVGKLSMKDILGLFKHDAAEGGHDKEDREMWEKFGGDNRLLDGPAHVSAADHVKDLADVYRPMPAASKPKGLNQEHDVYGRRW